MTVTLATPQMGPTFQLSTYKFDTTAAQLSYAGTMNFSGQPIPQFAVEPTSKSLYIAFPLASGGTIGIFSIDPTTGVPIQTSAFDVTQICIFCPPISGPGVLALNSTGSFLYYGSSTLGGGVFEGIGALAVNSSTGALSFVAGSPFPGDDAPFFVTSHPSGRFLYTENIDATGANGFTLQSISGFAIDAASGAITGPVAGSPFAPQVNSTISGLSVHPSGSFLYSATGFGMNGIMGWKIDVAGGLTTLPNSPFQPGTSAFGTGAFDPAGKFLYLSGGGLGGMLGFSVDSSGNLAPLPGSPFAPGLSLLDPVVDPTGQFLFVSQTINKTLLVFRLDGATGALTPVGNPIQLAQPAVYLAVVH